MPPDYNELPIPNEENVEKETNDIKIFNFRNKQ